MATTSVGAARQAHKDLTALLDAVRTEHGPDSAQRAADLLRTATREGRLDGSTYGRYTAAGRDHTVQVACVLGWVAVALDDEGARGSSFGHSPRTLRAFMYHGVGREVEDYVSGVEAGDRPASSRTARNIARWCSRWLKETAPAV